MRRRRSCAMFQKTTGRIPAVSTEKKATLAMSTRLQVSAALVDAYINRNMLGVARFLSRFVSARRGRGAGGSPKTISVVRETAAPALRPLATGARAADETSAFRTS